MTTLADLRAIEPRCEEAAMQCHACGRLRSDGEGGWVRVTVVAGGPDDGAVMNFYCPDHAGAFPVDDPNVDAVE